LYCYESVLYKVRKLEYRHITYVVKFIFDKNRKILKKKYILYCYIIFNDITLKKCNKRFNNLIIHPFPVSYVNTFTVIIYQTHLNKNTFEIQRGIFLMLFILLKTTLVFGEKE